MILFLSSQKSFLPSNTRSPNILPTNLHSHLAYTLSPPPPASKHHPSTTHRSPATELGTPLAEAGAAGRRAGKASKQVSTLINVMLIAVSGLVGGIGWLMPGYEVCVAWLWFTELLWKR